MSAQQQNVSHGVDQTEPYWHIDHEREHGSMIGINKCPLGQSTVSPIGLETLLKYMCCSTIADMDATTGPRHRRLLHLCPTEPGLAERSRKKRAEHKFDKFIFHYSSRFFLFDSSCWLDGAKSSATRCGCGDARASELAKSLENSNLIPKARIKILGMFSTINHQLKIFFALPQSL